MPELRTERLLMRALARRGPRRVVRRMMGDPDVCAGARRTTARRAGARPGATWPSSRATGRSRASGTGCSRSSTAGESSAAPGSSTRRTGPASRSGWTVAREHWGKGYAPEAGRAACEWAHDVLGARHIISLIRPSNEQLDPRGGEARRAARGEPGCRRRREFDAARLRRATCRWLVRPERRGYRRRMTRTRRTAGIRCCSARRRRPRARPPASAAAGPSTRTRRAARSDEARPRR